MPLFQSESKGENDVDLYENETACRTHFHMKGFAHRLVFKERHKRTRKWPIGSASATVPDWHPIRSKTKINCN